jgi:hypothetical protein
MNSAFLLRRCLALSLATVGCAASLVSSQVVVLTSPSTMPEGAQQGLPKIADVIKDMQVIGDKGGMLTFYHYDENDPAKDHTRLLALVPKALLGQDLLMANSFSRGPQFGLPLDEGVLVRFEQVGNRVLLLAPDTRLKDDGNKEIQAAVRNTYRPEVLAGLQIMATDGNGGLLVDLSPMVFGGLSSVPLGGVRRDLSRLNKIKAFPENVLIDVDVATTGSPYGLYFGGGFQGAMPVSTVGVSYAFRKLPPLGSYTPRFSDERVGYFTTVRQDWTIKYTDRENVVRYINRWNLKKQDPSLELSPPEKPITFILEKTIPIQFRKAVADGILEWNKAFEKIGITGAIVVQQQTDDNEFKDIDPEDARYNFIRWIVTGQGFAMGPSRPDPRTGQLLDADIVFDDSMVRFVSEQADILGPREWASDAGADVLSFFRANPAYLPLGVKLSSEDAELLRPAVPGATAGPSAGTLRPGLGIRSHMCQLGQGMRYQLALGQIMARYGAALAEAGEGDKPDGKTARKLPDRLIAQYVKEVTAHEVGHTLGLRHNFKASSWLSPDEIKTKRDTTDDPTSASVMDYNPLLFFQGDKLQSLRNICTNAIGPYDYWAIDYGYGAPAQGKKEEDFVSSVASKANNKELAYGSDEDVSFFYAPDPTTNLFDAGNDLVAWSRTRIALADELLKTVATWGSPKDDPNYVLRDTWVMLMRERVRTLPFAAKAVTGQYVSRARPGDPGAAQPFTLLSPAKQREALRFLGETLFSESFFDVPPDLYNKLGVRRYYDWTSYPASRTDFPVHSFVLSMQSFALSSLTSSGSLQRVYDAERKSAADDKFTAAELLSSVRDLIWADLNTVGNGRFTDSKPAISSFRRNLQQQYLQNMLSLAEIKDPNSISGLFGIGGSSLSPDLQNMVRYSLRDLSGKLGDSLKNKDRLDFATRAHLSEAKTRIDRVLDAPFVPESMGGGMILLLGQPQPGAGPAGSVIPPASSNSARPGDSDAGR